MTNKLEIPNWIDGDETLGVGDVGFLRRSYNSNHNRTTYTISSTPAQTNRSFEPRLYGWCGETDNRSLTALGLVRITRVAINGRMRLQPVTDRSEIEVILEDLGYSELATEIE